MHRGGSWLLRPAVVGRGAPFGARDAFTSVLALAITLALGRTGRLRVDLAEARAQTAEEAARRRSTEERLRIARELHDIIGHSLGTIAVQAGVGRHLMANEPERAAEALDSIARVGRSSWTRCARWSLLCARTSLTTTRRRASPTYLIWSRRSARPA